MKIGLWLTAQHPASVEPSVALRLHLEQVAMARRIGCHTVLAGQHFLPEPYWMFQNLPLLARVAAESGEMRVGTGVTLLTLLNPLEVAENYASLSTILDGRLVLGFGQGYRTVENAAFGIAEDGRGRVFEDKVTIVRRLLAGERVTAQGPGYRLYGAALGLLPAAPVPIWLAANNDAGVRRAARVGDSWLINPHSDLEQLERQVTLFHETRSEAGLPPAGELPAARELCVRSTDREAAEVARPYIERKYASYVRWGQEDTMPRGDSLSVGWAELAEKGRFIIGSPTTCRDLLLEHEKRLGATEIICRVQWPGMPQAEVLRTMEFLGSIIAELRSDESQKSPNG
jgi:alkanesulfonate monooxygenase SsuD/methylene tetrahydromethanopterin reductase-like flavin-dependent oxidoreductase (luciferase family)